MKTLTRLITTILVLTLLSCSALAQFVPPDSPDASSHISSCNAGVYNGGSGKLKVQFTIYATGTMTKLGATTIRIYKSNGTFVTSIHYTDSGRSLMMGNNNAYYTDTETITVSPGTYYAKVYFYAKNSSGYDEVTYTTTSKTIT